MTDTVTLQDAAMACADARADALEQAAVACERRYESLKAEGNTPAALEAWKCSVAIRKLKDGA